MEFKDTALYFFISKLVDMFDKDCVYVIILKLPFIVMLTVVSIPIALIMDLFYAAKDAFKP